MKICVNCNKRLHFWNSYHRKYPAIKVINGKTTPISFCSAKCVFEYMDKCAKEGL
jgi:hypothetical protein